MKKFLYIVLISFTFMLTSCENLGIEVTTFKGYWRSEKYDEGFFRYLYLKKDGTFDLFVMANDSTYSSTINGTWINEKDTISLFIQNNANNSKKIKKTLVIKQLTMDRMTVEGNKEYTIFTRLYNNPDNKFFEVLELKGGFLYGLCLVIGFVCTLACGGCVIAIIFYVLRFIYNYIRKLINK